MINGVRLDAVAIGLSGICVIHCLALPILVVFIPVLSSFSDAEWLHKALVLLALPVSVICVLRTSSMQNRAGFIFLVFIGALLLFCGAFVEKFHDVEVVLTLFGALTLSSAHLMRWRCSHIKSH